MSDKIQMGSTVRVKDIPAGTIASHTTRYERVFTEELTKFVGKDFNVTYTDGECLGLDGGLLLHYFSPDWLEKIEPGLLPISVDEDLITRKRINNILSELQTRSLSYAPIPVIWIEELRDAFNKNTIHKQVKK